LLLFSFLRIDIHNSTTNTQKFGALDELSPPIHSKSVITENKSKSIGKGGKKTCDPGNPNGIIII